MALQKLKTTNFAFKKITNTTCNTNSNPNPNSPWAEGGPVCNHMSPNFDS